MVPLILLKLNYKHEFGCILESILKHTFSVGEATLAQIALNDSQYKKSSITVSYTHLTLPTILLV